MAVAAELVLGVKVQDSDDVRLAQELFESQAYDFGQLLLGLCRRDRL